MRPAPAGGPRTVLYVNADAGLYGAGVSLLELASWLPADRYRPLMALPCEGPLADAFRARGVQVEVFPLGALRRTFRPDQVAGIAWSHVTGWRRLAGLIEAEGVAIVHTNCTHVLSGASAAKRTGRVHIGHVRENLLPPKAVGRALGRLLWAESDRVIAVSRATSEEFLGARRSAHAKVRVIHDGVDLEAFRPCGSPAEARQRLGWPTDLPHVGILARLARWKGHEVFLEASARLARERPDARLAIIGDADTARNQHYKARLLALAARLNLTGHVRWAGFAVPVQPLLAALDVVVVPSIRPEPFGRTVIEAMAMERPVVASDHGGPPEILAAGGGLLVPPGQAAPLAAAIGRLLADQAARIEMGRLGRHQATSRFGIVAHARAVSALYDEVIDGRPQG
jgi:glycosyltransferase involved in cell wall biosynthesis